MSSESTVSGSHNDGTCHLLTVNEVSPLLRTSRWTIYRLIKAELLPSVRTGRAHRIPRDFVEGFISEGRRGRSVDLATFAAEWIARTAAEEVAV